MDGEHLEAYEEIKEQKELAENTKWKRRKERVMQSWLLNEWTVWVFVSAMFLLAGITADRMFLNPILRDLKLVQDACGYENVSARTVEVSGASKAYFVCERVAQ